MQAISRLTYTADEVAAVLGLGPSYFRAKRPELEKAGFPPHLPTMPGRWSRAAVDAWIAGNGDRDPPPAASAAGVVRLEEARALLERRYGGAP